MALLFTDGCDSYAATSDFLKKWNSNAIGATYNATGGRWGGPCIVIPQNAYNTAMWTRALLGGGARVLGGFWLKLTGTPTGTGNRPILAFLNSSISGQGGISFENAAGRLGFHRWRGAFDGGAGITYYGTASVMDGQWHWIEFDINFVSSGGTSRLWVDGVLDLTTTSTMIESGTPDIQALGLYGQGGFNQFYDDIVVYSASGIYPTASHAPLGPLQIQTLRPNADVTAQFTPSASGASHYTMVNETVPDGDGNYVESNVAGNRDLFEFTDLSGNIQGVVGVMLNNYAKNAGGGTAKFRTVAKSGSSVDVGSDMQPTVAYLTHQQPWSLNPATGQAWTVSEVNAAQFGFDVT